MSAARKEQPKVLVEADIRARGLDLERVTFHRSRLEALGRKKSKRTKEETNDRLESHAWLRERGLSLTEEGLVDAPAVSIREPIVPIARGRSLEELEAQGESRAQRLRSGKAQNLEAELALLVLAVRSPEKLGQVLDEAEPEQFAGDSHRILLGQILDRRSRGLAGDVVTLGEDLRHNTAFLLGGGKELLARIVTATPPAAEPAELLGIVRGLSKTRRLAGVASGMKRALGEGKDAEEAISIFRAEIEAIEAEPAGTSSWGSPLLSENVAVSKFPLEVLPGPLREFVEKEAT